MPIKLTLSTQDPLQASADVLVLGVHEGASTREGPLGALVKAVGASAARVLKREEFTGKRDQSFEIVTNGVGARADHVLVIGLGPAAELTDADVRVLAARGARYANSVKARSLAIDLPHVAGAERAGGEGVVLGAYRFTRYMTGEHVPKQAIERASLLVRKAEKGAREAMLLGQQVGEAVTIARDLINEPPNELYPERLAQAGIDVCKANNLKYALFDKPSLERKGMRLIVAVGQGSRRDPRLLHMTYTPAGGKPVKKLVFVGKGLTFDTGGICIKPAGGMEEMKGDMGGAANVIALMAAVAAAKPNVEVHGIIACAENMPDGFAYRPGDIFKSYEGKTVEIINTDAEGRLVLADALAYANELKPDVILDNATLTGACVIALGPTVSGFYANQDPLAERFKTAAKAAGEAMWHMPLVEDLRDGLKSDWADIKHIADRWGGSITAALFLREFIGTTPWIHVDIAGPSLANKAYNVYAKGGTGHGVLTYLRFIDGFASS